jgi:hypothetical protein
VILSGFVGGVGANPFDLLCLGRVDFLRKPRTTGGSMDELRTWSTVSKEACGIKFNRIRR